MVECAVCQLELLLLIRVATDELLVEAGPTATDAQSVLEIIQTHDSSPRTAGYPCEVLNISGSFAGPRVVFLTACQFSYTLDILFVPTVIGRPLPAFREIARQSCAEDL